MNMMMKSLNMRIMMFEYEDNDALLNDFFSQVHEPTIKDKLSSRLKGILKPFKKNEKE